MIEVTVRPDGGEPYDLTIRSRDIYAWEKAGKGRSMSTLMESMSMVDITDLAWRAARRADKFPGPFDEFIATCDIDLGGEEDDEQPDPTRPARSPARRSRSRS